MCSWKVGIYDGYRGVHMCMSTWICACVWVCCVHVHTHEVCGFVFMCKCRMVLVLVKPLT